MLTPTHLAIVMEYAAGGELFERICSAGRFSEDEVKNVFHKILAFCCESGCHYISADYHLILIGKVLLPATDFGSELLPFHGTDSGKLLSPSSFCRALLTQYHSCLFYPAASMP